MADDFEFQLKPYEVSKPAQVTNPYQATSLPEPTQVFRAPDLATVQRGVAFVYLALVAWLALIVAIVLLGLFARGGISPGMATFINFVPLIGLAIGCFAIYGRILCLSAPARTGAKNIITAAVALDVTAMLVTILGFLVAIPVGVAGIGNLLSMIANVLFVIFLKRLAAYCRQRELADAAKNVLQYLITCVVLGIVMIAAAPFIPFISLIAGIVLFIVALVAFFAYARLLSNMADAL